MKKLLLSSFCALAALSGFAQSKVYMTEEITPEALVKVYEALGRSATGKVAVKISTGEPNGKNFLQPALIKDLVQKTGGTIVECNTAYEGRRYRTEDHRQVCIDHGFAAIAPVDIMDGEGEIRIPVLGTVKSRNSLKIKSCGISILIFVLLLSSYFNFTDFSSSAKRRFGLIL